MEDNWIGWYG